MTRLRPILLILVGSVCVMLACSACYTIGAAHAAASVVVDTGPPAAPAAPTPGLPIEMWIMLAITALGALRSIVRGAAELMGLISRRTANTVDDDVYRRLDGVADTLDDILTRLPGTKRGPEVGQ